MADQQVVVAPARRREYNFLDLSIFIREAIWETADLDLKDKIIFSSVDMMFLRNLREENIETAGWAITFNRRRSILEVYETPGFPSLCFVINDPELDAEMAILEEGPFFGDNCKVLMEDDTFWIKSGNTLNTLIILTKVMTRAFPGLIYTVLMDLYAVDTSTIRRFIALDAFEQASTLTLLGLTCMRTIEMILDRCTPASLKVNCPQDADFRHEKALKLPNVQYRDAVWLTVDDLVHNFDSNYARLAETTLDNDDINLMLRQLADTGFGFHAIRQIQLNPATLTEPKDFFNGIFVIRHPIGDGNFEYLVDSTVTNLYHDSLAMIRMWVADLNVLDPKMWFDMRTITDEHCPRTRESLRLLRRIRITVNEKNEWKDKIVELNDENLADAAIPFPFPPTEESTRRIDNIIARGDLQRSLQEKVDESEGILRVARARLTTLGCAYNRSAGFYELTPPEPNLMVYPFPFE